MYLCDFPKDQGEVFYSEILPCGKNQVQEDSHCHVLGSCAPGHDTCTCLRAPSHSHAHCTICGAGLTNGSAGGRAG
jgi:hypothetical protein